jgi:hypothetical protein
MLRQYELVEKVRGYDPDADEAMINRAYVFSMKAHGSQKRASGDPYYSHPIEVAGILTDLHLDDETIVTAILHDTIEDTVATRRRSSGCSAATSPAWSTASPSSARSRRRPRASAPRKICASSCSPCPTTSACCW